MRGSAQREGGKEKLYCITSTVADTEEWRGAAVPPKRHQWQKTYAVKTSSLTIILLC